MIYIIVALSYSYQLLTGANHKLDEQIITSEL